MMRNNFRPFTETVATKRKVFTYLTIAIASILTPLLLNSCEPTDNDSRKRLAKGENGELILVMDSVKWKGKLGEEIKDVFQYRLPGLPQPEAAYTVRYIEPSSFKGLLKGHKNIAVVTTFDERTAGSQVLQSKFTKESQQALKDDPSRYIFSQKDEYARDQSVLYLVGLDEATLIKKIRENKSYIRNYFHQVEMARMQEVFKRMRSNRKLMGRISTDHGFFVNLPDGYQLAKDTADFVWFRLPEAAIDKNLFFAYKPYTSEKQFSNDSLLAWREQIGKKYLQDPENEGFYVTLQDIAPIDFSETSLDKRYAKEVRGLWRIKERFVGGPFVGYLVADEANGRLFYIEGFVNAPGIEKREIVRELMAILDTFKPEPQ